MEDVIKRDQLVSELKKQRELYIKSHKKSWLHRNDRSSVLLYNSPMNWMQQWPLEFPLTIDKNKNDKVFDVDGNKYTDMCLGYSAAFPGHGSDAVSKDLLQRMENGMVYTIPSQLDAEVGNLLKERFEQDFWGFALSATDANRFVIKLCREITRRKKILVFNGCYHGTVEEAFAIGDGTNTVTREGNIGIGIDTSKTTTAIEFNDIDSLKRELSKEEYACVLLEPVMTNCGIIYPEEGYLDELKRLCKEYGTVYIIDEAHTITTSHQGYAKKYNLQPDILILGKCIGGGFPVGTYGVTEEIKERIDKIIRVEYSDTSGIGGTMTGSPMAIASIKSALRNQLTLNNFDKAIKNTEKIVNGINEIINECNLNWSVVSLGARFDIWFTEKPAKNAKEAFEKHDENLYEYIFTLLLNQGFIMSPYWNILGSVSPYTSEDDITKYLKVLKDAVKKII